jgi:hypothetical protein
MFTWLNKQGVQSDRGFVVQVVDRFTIAYREAEKTLSVPVEFARLEDGKSCVSVSPHAFSRWDDDAPGLMIPLEKQQEIFANFKAALKFQNLALVTE